MINSLNAQELLKTQDVQAVKKIYDIRFGGQYVVPASWGDQEKLAAKLSDDLFEVVAMAIVKYPNLTQDIWNNIALTQLKKPELGASLWAAY